VPLRIEDYALIGDTHTAALVGRDGSIDWLCLPRFDSPACFAALLGNEWNGRWKIAARGGAPAAERRYRPGTLVLETDFHTHSGVARVVDCMPLREQNPQIVRMVTGVKGSVEMEMELIMRFDYGSIIPWVRRSSGILSAIAGPDAVDLWTPLEVTSKDFKTVANFTISEGQVLPFVLSWHPSCEPPPRPVNPFYVLDDTEVHWQEWSDLCCYQGTVRDMVMRSLITLKALTYAPTGGIVAAPTTSLPEAIGGERNWDYRYCWLRDATFTLQALMVGGYAEEAVAWRDWLLRAVAGDPSKLQIMYGPAGERRLNEFEVDWLPGYEGSAPVRIGNAAAGQLQLDVYGEVIDALHQSHRVGLAANDDSEDLQRALLDFLERGWRQPDDGIWEVRGPRRHFTHSKVMAWVAMDRAVKSAEEFGMAGPVDRWKKVRQEIFDEVCEKGWSPDKQAFTQYFGSTTLDASVLMIPLVGFLPATDERVVKTVDAIGRELMYDGFVLRYDTDKTADVDGLTGREGAFLACSFWYVDNLWMIGRHEEARAMFDRLVGLANDVGLLAEEYDPVLKRQVGNFPQAFSHISLVNSAYCINEPYSPAAVRSGNATMPEIHHEPRPRHHRQWPRRRPLMRAMPKAERPDSIERRSGKDRRQR
jgi:GH15 family glucan-1,4-alpha-glucosidase